MNQFIDALSTGNSVVKNGINFVMKKAYNDLMALINEVTSNERYKHIN